MVDIAFFLEEPSAQNFLKEYIRRHFPTLQPIFIVFEGKQDLERRLKTRLQGWMHPKPNFVVIRDQDSGDCRMIKNYLVDCCNNAGHRNVIICIACRELESWFLGDLNCIATAYSNAAICREKMRRKFRDPDTLTNAKEELKKLTNGEYQPMSGSKLIGQSLQPDNNNSRSFQYLNKKLMALSAEF